MNTPLTDEQIAAQAAEKAAADAAEKARKEQEAAEKKAKADADKAAKAEKKAADKKAADEKKAADKAAKVEAAAKDKAAKDAEKLAKDEAKAKAAADKEAAKEAAKMPIQNGIRRPKPETLCGKAWAVFDAVSMAKGQPTSIKEALEHPDAAGLNPANVRCEYAAWRKFFGVTGRIDAPKPPEAPKAEGEPATTETSEALATPEAEQTPAE